MPGTERSGQDEYGHAGGGAALPRLSVVYLAAQAHASFHDEGMALKDLGVALKDHKAAGVRFQLGYSAECAIERGRRDRDRWDSKPPQYRGCPARGSLGAWAEMSMGEIGSLGKTVSGERNTEGVRAGGRRDGTAEDGEDGKMTARGDG